MARLSLYAFIVLGGSLSLTQEQEEKPELLIKTSSGPVRYITFSKNGKYLAFSNGMTNVYDFSNMTLKLLLDENSTCAAFTKDGNNVVFAMQNGFIVAYELETGIKKRVVGAHSKEISSVVMNKSDKRVISASIDGTIKLWDFNGGFEIFTFEGHTSGIISMSVTPDEKNIISAGYDGVIKIWSIEDLREVKSFEAYELPLISMSLTQDGKQIITSGAGERNTIWLKRWKAETGKLADKIEIDISTRIAVSPDGENLAYFGNKKTVEIRDPGRFGRTLRSFSWYKDSGADTYKRAGTVLTFSPDGKYILCGDQDGDIRIFESDGWKINAVISAGTSWIYSISTYYSNEKYILTSTRKNYIVVWDLIEGIKLFTLSGHKNLILSTVIINDGNSLVSVCYDGTIKIWNLQDGEIIKTIECKDARLISGVAVSRSGERMATLHHEGIIKIWSLPDAKLLNTFTSLLAIRIAITSDDENIIIGNRQPDPNNSAKSVLMLDLKSGKEMAAIPGTKAGHVYSLSLNDDYLIIGGSNGMVYCKVEGFEFNVLFSDEASVRRSAMSSDRLYAASGGADGTIKIWDLAEGKLLHFIEKAHKGEVQALNITGKHLISAGWDGKIKFWDLESGELIGVLVNFDYGDWIFHTPDQRYDHSERGNTYARWTVKKEGVITGQYSLEKFEENFKVQDLVRKVFND
ncbi:MAG: WD40 repeat domain-containing protein [Planctomycetes bacterium]|nr:WD40 repeat domain-containing protein [Planctomycetota bacterium]